MLKKSIIQLLAKLAILPPVYKTRFLMRIAAFIARKFAVSQEKLPRWTNLGIQSGLRIEIPEFINTPLYLFGRPDNYPSEFGALGVISKLVDHSDAFFDIGSHLGYFGFFCRSRREEIPIFCIEANPQLSNTLEKNIATNKLPHFQVLSTAIGKENGTASFFINQHSLLESSLVRQTNVPSIELKVAVSSFDTLIASTRSKNALVKVDVENAEFEFVEGAIRSKEKIRFLVMEVLLNSYQRGIIPYIEKHLELRSYYIRGNAVYEAPGGVFSAIQDNSEYNWLFTRETPESLQKLLKDIPVYRRVLHDSIVA